MSSSKKILIIDDEPDARAFIKAILEDDGYEILTASDGGEGLKIARETPPNLITLDLMMPNKSGVKFLNEIKRDEQLKGVPIVVASGARRVTGVDMKQFLEDRPFQERKKEAMGDDRAVTPDAYLEKPINPAELLDTVKKLIQKG
ncbi:MAG: response regulator [Candidatus Aminicenantes bacterium]|jgi:CheY-like chemotaxis protein